MTDGAKWRLLALLMLLLLVVVAYRVLNRPEPQRVALTYTAGQTAGATSVNASPALIHLDSKQVSGRQGPRRPSKNIFAPLEFPKPEKKPAVKVKAAPPPPPRPIQPAAPPAPSPEELAAAQARKRMAAYRILGYSQDGGQPRAFLGKGRKIFIAGVGEELEDRIQVAAITEKAVRLRETRSQSEATLQFDKTAK